MPKWKSRRKGGFRRLTKPRKRYTLIYVDVANGETITLGTYSSLATAKQELEERQITRGQLAILSDANRVVYSKKGGSIDAE